MSSIYVHIPYCHSKCAYCDFYYTPRSDSAERMVRAICREYELRRAEIGSDKIKTLYIGGGTPSILADALLERLIDALPTPEDEFTIEVNPEDVTEERATNWRKMGINRVSMGVQSLVDSELKAIGRRHTAAQALAAAHTIRDSGIDNISLDLIYGLPGQTMDTWRHSLDGLLEFRPEHLSAYILSYEPGTRLTAMLHAGKIQQAEDLLIEQMYAELCARTSATGYEHYEISNFAQPGRRARHNSGYWHGASYLGLGPAAHSFDGILRRINPSSEKNYLSAIESGNVAYEIDEETPDNRFNDLLITRLRTCEGLPLNIVEPARLERLLRDAAPLLSRGDLKLSSTHLSIPASRWLTSDTTLTTLMQI